MCLLYPIPHRLGVGPTSSRAFWFANPAISALVTAIGLRTAVNQRFIVVWCMVIRLFLRRGCSKPRGRYWRRMCRVRSGGPLKGTAGSHPSGVPAFRDAVYEAPALRSSGSNSSDVSSRRLP